MKLHVFGVDLVVAYGMVHDGKKTNHHLDDIWDDIRHI